MNETPQKTLTFNEDGTVNPEDLAGYPQAFIDKVTSSEFIAQARHAIAQDKLRQQALARVQGDIRKTREKAIVEQQSRRPSGISGRQRKLLRRTIRKVRSATIGA